MEYITTCPTRPLAQGPAALDLTPLPSNKQKRLGLTPLKFVEAIHAVALAEWAVQPRAWRTPPALPKPRRGRPQQYRDASILVLSVVQIAWRMPYAVCLEYLADHPELGQALSLPLDTTTGQVRCISQSQYWERRQALGILPLMLFMLGLVAQLVRLGVITGQALVLDATRLKAWHTQDPGAAWARFRGTRPLFGYKVHVVLDRLSALPVLVLVTPANLNEVVVAIPLLWISVVLFGFQVRVVYGDAAYFDSKVLHFIRVGLGAWAAVDYNVRKRGKKAVATLPFIWFWRRQVLWPRRVIERHFAWAKRYFGIKYFQCWTAWRVTQYVILTYCAILGVALAAERYQRPDLRTQRAAVLARALP